MGLRHSDFMAIFDQWASTYDQTVYAPEAADGFEDYEQVLARVVQYAGARPGAALLDVGAGTGNLAQAARAAGAEVTAVEPSAAMRQVAAQKLPGARVVPGTFLSLPVGNESQDAVVSTYAFHHLTDADKLLGAQEMVRVLRPGGRVVIGDYAWTNESARVAALAKWEAAGRADLVQEIQEEYYPTVGVLVAAFAAQGCSVYLEQVNEWVWIMVAQKGKGFRH